MSENLDKRTSRNGMKYQFPDSFLWGAATSSHQIEGNTNNDWSRWEKDNAEKLAKAAKDNWAPWQQEKFPEMFEPENYISGAAADHWNRYEEDFDILEKLGFNAYRFSIEWSRIEPEEGKWDEEAVAHYRKMIAALQDRGIEPKVTLWHWPFPLWLADSGGWFRKDAPELFARYAEKMASELGDVKFWSTLNEPEIYAFNSYMRGMWPPGKKSPLAFWRVTGRMIKAHKAAYQAIKGVSRDLQVGVVKDNTYYESAGGFVNNVLVRIVDTIGNHHFLKKIARHQDFIGLNYYFRNRVNWGFNKNDNEQVSDMGWELYPDGLYYVLRDLKRYNVPIYITEAGIADADDSRRADYVAGLIKSIARAREDNADVRGYCYWSLLDNFEWDKGFWPRFGLVEIDYQTQARTIRPSAFEYAKIVQSKSIEL